MNTKITITSNGNVSPNIVFDLGNKYESVGDTLEFVIPREYRTETNHYYLTFKMKRMETIILPVNNFIFEIGRTITEHPGTYDIIFLATKNAVINGDIESAKTVFISNTMKGAVKDNYLQDPITDTTPDPNIELYYNKLDALSDQLKYNMDNKVYQGDYYMPHVDEFGYLTWTIMEGDASAIPTPSNLTGPTGPYYIPAIVDGELQWNKSNNDIPDIAAVDLDAIIEGHTDDYLDENFALKTEPMIQKAVVEEVDNTFKFYWNEETKELFIYSADSITEEDGDDVAYGS